MFSFVSLSEPESKENVQEGKLFLCFILHNFTPEDTKIIKPKTDYYEKIDFILPVRFL